MDSSERHGKPGLLLWNPACPTPFLFPTMPIFGLNCHQYSIPKMCRQSIPAPVLKFPAATISGKRTYKAVEEDSQDMPCMAMTVSLSVHTAGLRRCGYPLEKDPLRSFCSAAGQTRIPALSCTLQFLPEHQTLPFCLQCPAANYIMESAERQPLHLKQKPAGVSEIHPASEEKKHVRTLSARKPPDCLPDCTQVHDSGSIRLSVFPVRKGTVGIYSMFRISGLRYRPEWIRSQKQFSKVQ